MYEVFSVESRKGGVGKTTVALNLAKVLIKKGYDVLLVDCDITGTPISNAVLHSDFWKNSVSVSKHDETPNNLIDYFQNVYLRKSNTVDELIKGLEYHPRKIHIIGSEIYDSDGALIIDPRYLLDDMHSFWFLRMIKDIADGFKAISKKENTAIVLDNSPGYVGIGRSVREWLTQELKDRAKFILVSSLDEQDVDSTISSAQEIVKMIGSVESVSDYVRVVINRVPSTLVEEGSGYDFGVGQSDKRDSLVRELFPLDSSTGFPKNIIKFDEIVSTQFIEQRIKPQINKEIRPLSELESAFSAFDNKVSSYESKADKFGDIVSMNTYYRKLLNSLERTGYVRISKSMGGSFMPGQIIWRLKHALTRLNQEREEVRGELISIEGIKSKVYNRLSVFLERTNLMSLSSLFFSVLDGVYKYAGANRKEKNYCLIENLSIALTCFFYVQEAAFKRGGSSAYESENSYSMFLQDEMQRRVTPQYYFLLESGPEEIAQFWGCDVSFIRNMSSLFLGVFYQTMCYVLLRLIDCSRDYSRLLEVINELVLRDMRRVSVALIGYLNATIVKKSEAMDENKLVKLILEPFEMADIQKVLSAYALK